MDLEYVRDKLYVAIRTLVLMDLPLQKRITSGFVCSELLKIDLDDVPIQLREQFYLLREDLLRIKPVEGDGLETSMHIMSFEEASEIAIKIIDIYDEIGIILGSERASGDSVP
ncbi:MAG: hypothetical protein KatS3mg057_1264 [Herpetosiphonaceae bacterium]|nr:MAG: hypothetical protein KatS3mg057_1264 [Herpetosiphonaceae bacterium]